MNVNILKPLKRKDLVPVIGNDLSIVRILKSEIANAKSLVPSMESAVDEGKHIEISLNDYLAFKIWNGYEPNKEPPSPFTLNNVVQRLLTEKTTKETEIKAEILHITKNLKDHQIALDPFRKLAKISNFETILSVNFDNFLERAFEAEGKSVNPSINFSIQEANDSGETENRDRALSTIFNLMGNVYGMDIAITEEMQLEYLFNLMMGKDAKTKALFKAIKDKSFILIGCSFPNWFMRFFIRTISKNRFKEGRPKFVASDRTSQDIDLSSFLENHETRVIPIGVSLDNKGHEEEVYANTIEFIDELFELAENTDEVVTSTEPRYNENVFISYSWDDKSIVRELINEFENNGVDVFFDEADLRNGEDFGQTIKEFIMTCDYVVPIISRHSIRNKESYVYKDEWLHAISVEMMKIYNKDFKEGQKNFLRPYIIDDTSPVDGDIPAEIRQRNITTVSPEDGFPEMVREFIKENLTEISEENG